MTRYTPSSIGISRTPPPPPGCIKININGSFGKKNPRSGSCGSLTRDSNYKLIRRFYQKLGSCDASWAWLWALKLGVNLGRELALPLVVFELDSKVVLDMVNVDSTHISYFNLYSMRSSVSLIFRN